MQFLSLLTIPYRKYDFSTYKEVGHGRERRCFASDRHPRLLFKCASIDDCKQSLREYSYYKHLQRRKVPLTHLPHFITVFKTDSVLVTVQQFVKDDKHYEVKSLEEELRQGNLDADKLQRAFDEFKAYIFKWRIITNDMFNHNFLLKVKKEGENQGEYRLVLIDGLGAVSFIPLANYVRFLALKRINRQCLKFVQSVRATSGGKINLKL